MAGLNLFTNNAATTLASGLSSVATSLTVATGDGAEFPTLAGAEYFFCTLANNAGSIEIIKVTARSTDTFTIVRAQDGTSAASWSAGDKVELRLTRIDLLNFPQLDSTNTFTQTQTFTTPILGTPTSGTLTSCTGLPLTTGVTGTLPIANGGTGTTSTTFANLTTNVTGTLPVANGGTGATTLTANNVILGNGTSAVSFVAPSTSGNVLTSNGTTWTSAAAGGMTLLATITTTSGTTVNSGTISLTTYKQVQIVLNSVSNSGTSGNFQLADPNATLFTVASNPGTAANGITGIITIDLATGILSGGARNNTSTSLPDVNNTSNAIIGKTTFSTASTIFTFSTTAGAFDAGSILVYGIK